MSSKIDKTYFLTSGDTLFIKAVYNRALLRWARTQTLANNVGQKIQCQNPTLQPPFPTSKSNTNLTIHRWPNEGNCTSVSPRDIKGVKIDKQGGKKYPSSKLDICKAARHTLTGTRPWHLLNLSVFNEGCFFAFVM